MTSDKYDEMARDMLFGARAYAMSTEDDVRVTAEYLRRAVREALEEAARALEQPDLKRVAGMFCADAIRALMPGEKP